MNRLIDQSFTIGPGHAGHVVMLNDAIAILNEEVHKRMAAEETVTVLQIELAEAKADLEKVTESWLRIFPKFRRMRDYMKQHCERDYARMVKDMTEPEQDDGRRAR